MIKNFYIFFVFVFCLGCESLEFTYNNSNSLKNPILNNTVVNFYGEEIDALFKYKSRYFGKSNGEKYNLDITIKEEKIKRSVQTNQAIKKLDYEINLEYVLYNNSIRCIVDQKSITSFFTYEPKSSGYNFGSDQSLNNLYEIAISNNFEEFINYSNTNDLSKCLYES